MDEPGSRNAKKQEKLLKESTHDIVGEIDHTSPNFKHVAPPSAL